MATTDTKGQTMGFDASVNLAVNYRAALQFLFGGKAIATVVNDDSGQRFTYRLTQCEDKPELTFVGVLTGSNNTSDYTYIGTIWNGGSFKHGRKSRISADATSVKAFAWVLRKLSANQLPPQVRIHHEGRCCCCGRKLTTPQSIETGIGPVCANR